MVNWQEAGKTWPQPHPHAVYLLRGLVWDQHYRHSNPQCEGGMPGSFELRENMGADRLQAVEDWLRVEGYAYRFRQKRSRVWGRPDLPGKGLRPNRIDEDENPNEYPSSATINVSIWDMIEKNFREPGDERTLQGSHSSASPGKEKRSAGDKKRDKKWREYQESMAAEAAQAAENETKGGAPAPSPLRATGGHHPGHTSLGDFFEVAKKAKAKPPQLHLRKSGPSSKRGVGPLGEEAGQRGQLKQQHRPGPKERGPRLRACLQGALQPSGCPATGHAAGRCRGGRRRHRPGGGCRVGQRHGLPCLDPGGHCGRSHGCSCTGSSGCLGQD